MIPNVPVIPLLKALRQYRDKYNLPFRLNRLAEWMNEQAERQLDENQ